MYDGPRDRDGVDNEITLAGAGIGDHQFTDHGQHVMRLEVRKRDSHGTSAIWGLLEYRPIIDPRYTFRATKYLEYLALKTRYYVMTLSPGN